MNINDVATIRTRCKALFDWLPKVDTLTALYRDRQIIIVGIVNITLTAGQRTSVLNEANSLIARLTTLSSTLPTPTGKTGIVNQDEVARVEAEPSLILQLVENLITRQLDPLLNIQSNDLGDGTFNFVFEDNDAQRLANILSTLNSQVIVWLNVMRGRLP